MSLTYIWCREGASNHGRRQVIARPGDTPKTKYSAPAREHVVKRGGSSPHVDCRNGIEKVRNLLARLKLVGTSDGIFHRHAAQPGELKGLGQSEIGHLGRSVPNQKNVCRLEITMDDPCSASVFSMLKLNIVDRRIVKHQKWGVPIGADRDPTRNKISFNVSRS
jgi:hypothetical protein